MAFYTQFPRPVVYPWVDLRRLAGGTYSGWTVDSSAGIYKSYWHASPAGAGRYAGNTPYRQSQAVIDNLADGVYGFDRDGAFLRSSASFTFAAVTGYASGKYVAQLYDQASPITSSLTNRKYYEIRAQVPRIDDDFCYLYAIVDGTTYGSSSTTWYLPALTRAPLPAQQPLTSLFTWANPISGLQKNTNSSYSPHSAIIEATGIDGNFYAASALQSQMMRIPALYPTRPLASPPKLVEESKATDLITVGGSSYTCRHSVRKVWEVELLLDGAVDCFSATQLQKGGLNAQGYYPIDGLDIYDRFLRQVEISGGCTLYIDADDIGCNYIRPRPYFCGGYPCEICGRLVGATNLTISAQKGLSRRYPITLRIAEQEPDSL